MTGSSDPRGVLADGGEMGHLMRGIDWASTPVGPVDSWPQSLRTALSILLQTGFPMYIAWGREFTQFYNDGFRPILGSTKHPAAMGISTRETFAEIWEMIGPMFLGVMEGQTTTLVDALVPLDRHGFSEECYFFFSYSPIRQESGEVGGVLVTVAETTQRVQGERRLKTSQALSAETRDARTVGEACEIAARVLGVNTADLPFIQIYLTSSDRRTARLAAQAGEPPPDGVLPATIALDVAPFALLTLPDGHQLLQLGQEGQPVEVGPTVAAGGRQVALAIAPQGAQHPVGILVARTSAQLPMDEAYRDFLALVASQVGSAITAARALEEAKARADALAQLDRAKTTFFSNVSHEFRTPLTLMIGPTEEALASPECALTGAELRSVHRNELRLLKLVNTLLDFSRIEAGRVSASFEPVELSSLTANLASAFRSATERAGLELRVECAPLDSPVHVDREMWEKIVLNLLSNAFKFTLEGSITVELRATGSHAELRVRDTGVGIAAEDVGRLFERFYRVARAEGRTHEGSGIGLALVRELVGIHGGTIDVSSSIGEGTEFTVRIPLGTEHLPSALVAPAGEATTRTPVRVNTPPSYEPPSVEVAAKSYVQEALRWLPSDAGSRPVETPSSGELALDAAAARILVADDNADMREYLTRLLSARFQVRAVRDGRAALTAARRDRPDIIVSDVMMPGLDGFELLAALRAGEDTRGIPVILLSARAGEDSRIEGLNAGADDYLVKPFSARELMARVEAQLVRLKMRSLEEEHALRLANVFAQAPVGVAILRGPDHNYEFANREYLDLVDGREVLGKSVREALPELEGQRIYELLDRVYASGEGFLGRSIPLSLVRSNGRREEVFFDFAYQPLVDDDQVVNGIAVVAFNVTELTQARREAEAANRAKDEFLAMLGHELRNPLAPIVTALQLMRLRQVEGADRERTIIERQVNHVVSLVDDLLDVSRITRGQVTLKRERVDLADIVAKAVEMTAPALQGRRHRLAVHVPRGLVVHGDAARLSQVVANLLTNAAKYTDAGGSVSVHGRCDDEVVELEVADSGRGISPEMLPRIFDLFSQERQEIDRSEGGLGLGLAIVNSLVQGHGGSVHAHSDGKGRGSRFTIRLPLDARVHTPVPDAAMRLQRHAPEGGRRVLVVDDNADALELLADSLRALGHHVTAAANGASALDEVASFRPEVVLLDLGLPVMDGYEVARLIRSTPDSRQVQIVAVSGYGREVDRQRTRDAGFDGHLVKPVNLEGLDEWLRADTRPGESPELDGTSAATSGGEE